MKVISALLITLLLSTSVSADDDDKVYDLVSFSVSVEEDVGNDEMIATLAAEHRAKSSGEVSQTINERMARAMKRLSGHSDIKASTGNYQIYAQRDRDGELRSWNGSQQLRLSSRNHDQVSKAIGELEGLATIKSMGFEISKQRRDAVQDRLIKEAIKAFKQRAELVRAQMEAGSYRLVNMQINTGGNAPAPVFARQQMMRMAADSAPVVQSGTSKVSVSISGVIELSQR